jgi:hypothetical protein
MTIAPVQVHFIKSQESSPRNPRTPKAIPLMNADLPIIRSTFANVSSFHHVANAPS